MDPYRSLIYEFNLERQPMTYVVNIIIPCMMLSLLGGLALFLPCDNGEKLSLEMTVMLAFAVFLLLVSDIAPQSSTIPIISMYYLLVCSSQLW